MDYKKSYTLLTAGILAGAAVVFLGLSISTKMGVIGNVTAVIGLAAMLGGLGQAFLFYKCPDCGRRFNIRGRKPDHCPGCGRRL